MRILWLTNMIPGAVQQHFGRNASDGMWVDQVLQGLMENGDAELRILSMGLSNVSAVISDRLSCCLFTEKLPYRYEPELEAAFAAELREYRPDVIHIWGTEYGHTLAMVNAASASGLLDRTVVSIQGLCSVIARHYAEGLPLSEVYGLTFRDAVRMDTIALQRRKFERRGSLEIQALQKVPYVIGRTPWDYSCTEQINPKREYLFCNETLRNAFYTGSWNYRSCVKHRIFASSCSYPVKGFHYLLEAFAEVLKEYPDAEICVTGRSFLQSGLRTSRYERYLATLARKIGAEDKIRFCGQLNAEQMRSEYLQSNVFVLPSTVENSPNSLGEAMLLGVPCVAADVGGVSTMLHSETEGYVYQSTAPYLLAHYIKKVFAMEDRAECMGRAAAAHAGETHDPAKNLKDLLEIYRSICR